jgi:hypothetical protein
MKAFCLAVAIAATFALSAPALAMVETVNVDNSTDSCAWVSVYNSYGFSNTWSDVGNQWSKPHTTIQFHVPKSVEIKVNAKVNTKADCSGTNHYDTWDIKKGVMNDHGLVFELMKGNGREWLWFKRVMH